MLADSGTKRTMTLRLAGITAGLCVWDTSALLLCSTGQVHPNPPQLQGPSSPPSAMVLFLLKQVPRQGRVFACAGSLVDLQVPRRGWGGSRRRMVCAGNGILHPEGRRTGVTLCPALYKYFINEV